jgi:hypothetical protein
MIVLGVLVSWPACEKVAHLILQSLSDSGTG